ncbi:uncharacterized protein LOC144128023 isoform X3 [Amblyomma americanum]
MPTDVARVCSTHFVGNCISNMSGHPSYIPTIFPPVYKKKAPDRERTQRCQRRLIQAASSRLHSIKKRRLPQTTKVSVPTAPTLDDSVSADETEEEHGHQMDCSDKFEDDGMLTSDTDDLQSPTTGGLSLVTKADVACQTESSATGKLTIFLSMTNCDEASAQVTHTEQTNQVTRTDGSWRRRCGFQGFNSLQGNEETLQDVCGVTLPVYSLLLNLLPTSWYKSTDVTRTSIETWTGMQDPWWNCMDMTNN